MATEVKIWTGSRDLNFRFRIAELAKKLHATKVEVQESSVEAEWPNGDWQYAVAFEKATTVLLVATPQPQVQS